MGERRRGLGVEWRHGVVKELPAWTLGVVVESLTLAVVLSVGFIFGKFGAAAHAAEISFVRNAEPLLGVRGLLILPEQALGSEDGARSPFGDGISRVLSSSRSNARAEHASADRTVRNYRLVAGSRPTSTTSIEFVATKPGGAVARACRTGNSFRSDTEVVMADGTRKPISELKVRDEVIATDPETGFTAVRAVTAVHLNLDTELADLTVVDDDGDVSVIHSTQHHPFWSVADQAWTDVVNLQRGDRLRSEDGSMLKVVGLRAFDGRQWMWDLTISGIHTFYVANGDEAVLVHNCVEGSDLDLLIKRGGKTTTDFEDVATRLAKNSGVSREAASKRLHTIKGGVENNRDVVFTRSGGVYDATSGDYLGSLTGG